jgi:dipeptidyl aminopeptidase/acylaminoacyl peptidase
MSAGMPHVAEFIVQSSPRTHEQRLSCPVMIFHAADDTNVPIASSREFAKRMQAAGKDVTLKEASSGDHYDSMIEQGIPAGIAWMKEHLRK